MQAYVIPSAQSLGKLYLSQDVALPPPARDEVRVHVKAVSLNPIDYKLIDRGSPLWTYPHTPGVDGAGIVENVGDDVYYVRRGERVYFHHNLTRNGTFAEFVNVKALAVARLLEPGTFEAGAALPCAGFTAYQAIERKLHLHSGETILIQGASGGVGSYAVQFAKLVGARVLATCSTAHLEYVAGLGADAVIDYTQENVPERVRQLTDGYGADAILDNVSPASATQDIALLRFNGRLAFAAGAPDFSKFKPFIQGISFHEIALGGAHLSGDDQALRELGQIGQEVMQLLITSRLKDCVTQVLPFAKLPEGLAQLKAHQVHGKIVCTIP
jgi:NADPH:quinone reductase-like Zn-dependent oxidoreductase